MHGPNIDNYSFRSIKSMFEYDVVLWDPNDVSDLYARDPWSSRYLGYPNISTDDSPILISDLVRRNKEIVSFLEMGRVFVVLSAPPSYVYYATGESKTSGTGKNAKTTNMVDKIDIASTVLPVKYEASAGAGEAIDPKDEGFRSVWRADREAWHYRAIFTEPAGSVLATVAGTDMAVASILRTKGDGVLLMLPAMYPIIADDEDGGGDDAATSALFHWITQLTGGEDAELPLWAGRYQFAEDVERANKVSDLEITLASTLDQIEELKAEQAEADQWKLLYTASGGALEKQVRKAFELIGFRVENGPPGRTDLRLELDGRHAVAEVKGVGKSAKEENAAQLEKWISEERMAGISNPKGILLVNGWRNDPLEDRTRPTFPDQMVKFSSAREHCLLTAIQLLAMVRACLEDPTKAPEIARSIMDTVGVMPGWSDLPFAVLAGEGVQETKDADVDTVSALEA
ncbi:hypothetical protein ABZ771_01450 [Streptomyces globisporus]|uniref:hypothetical protein n=1 Tax=Streptomyces globisporus TaxID=1908 RepID=UPI0034615F97